MKINLSANRKLELATTVALKKLLIHNFINQHFCKQNSNIINLKKKVR